MSKPTKKINRCKHYQLFGGGHCNLVKADMMCSGVEEKVKDCIWYERLKEEQFSAVLLTRED